MLDHPLSVAPGALDRVVGGFYPVRACRTGGDASRRNEIEMLKAWQHVAIGAGRPDGPDAHPNFHGWGTRFAYADGCMSGVASEAKKLIGR